MTISRATPDMGAEGIMVPLVNDAHEAEELVSFVKYFPDGNRGVGVGLAHDNSHGRVGAGEA